MDALLEVNETDHRYRQYPGRLLRLVKTKVSLRRLAGTCGQESLNGPDRQVSSRQLPQGGAVESGRAGSGADDHTRDPALDLSLVAFWSTLSGI